MNSLSWFLYAADVLHNLAIVLSMIAVACILFCAGCGLGQLVTEGEMSKECPRMWRIWWRCAISAAALLALTTFFPSRNTMYAIAASQVGEKIAMSGTVHGIADDATKALHQWIKRQIEPEKSK
jgi:tetrahydromethanopterin S-methyltransferase subunit D